MVVSMERWIGKVAVVTGASSGIGEAIARQLVEEGMIVAALARRKEKLDKIKKEIELNNNNNNKTNGHANSYIHHMPKGQFHSVQCDVSKEEDVAAAIKWIVDNLGPFHVFINNAGIADMHRFSEGNVESWRKIIDINLFGVVLCTREALQVMKSHNINGHIINMNSIIGHYMPKELIGNNVYSATKYGVTAFTELIRLELADENRKIKITSISPGSTESELTASNQHYIDAFKMKMLSGADIADAVVYVLATPPHVQVKELTIQPTAEKF